MNACRACGTRTFRDLCHFCRRTVELVKADRCVSCSGPVARIDDRRVEGRCGDCRSRQVTVGPGTRALLHLLARSRYRSEVAACA